MGIDGIEELTNPAEGVHTVTATSNVFGPHIRTIRVYCDMNLLASRDFNLTIVEDIAGAQQWRDEVLANHKCNVVNWNEENDGSA